MSRRRTGPTSLSERVVVHMLKNLRERAGLTLEDAARTLPGDGRLRVWRMETGRVAPQRQLVEQLLDVYEAPDETRTECLARLEAAQRRPWWNDYRDVLDPGLIGRLDLEHEARGLRIYAPGMWPELLATPDLIHSYLVRAHPHDPPSVIDRRVELHLRRIEMTLGRTPPVGIWAILEEAVLHREVASPRIMRAQIQHLERLRTVREISIQILPSTRGSEIQLSGSMQMARCDHPLIPDTLIYRTPNGVVITQDRQEVEKGYGLFMKASIDANKPGEPLPPTRH